VCANRRGIAAMKAAGVVDTCVWSLCMGASHVCCQFSMVCVVFVHGGFTCLLSIQHGVCGLCAWGLHMFAVNSAWCVWSLCMGASHVCC
jgi:hypothetical protein